MHIVIDAREYSTSTGRYIERLIHYLQLVDTTNRYTILLKLADMPKWQTNNPNFAAVACPYKEFGFGEQFGFAWQLYRLRADVVHFGMTQQPLIYLKKSVTTIHDLTTARFVNPAKPPLTFRVKQAVYKAVIWYAAWKSRLVITPSQYVASDLSKYTKINPAKVVVTYESADKINHSPAALPYLQNKEFIMYVGRPTPHKNLLRLVEAFRQTTNPHLHLVLVGKADANFQALQKRYSDVPRLIFTGLVSDAELRWLYEHARAYVFPSLSEGFGLPGLEAMQYDLPLASSNASCLPEIYGPAALYFDPLNVESITKAIDRITTDEELRRQLGIAATQQRARYSWQRMAEQTLEVYLKIG